VAVLDVGVAVGVVAVGVGVGDVVGVAVEVAEAVGVEVALCDRVGVDVEVGVVCVAVGAAWVLGVLPADADAGVVGFCFAGVFDGALVADGCVVSPSRDVVGVPPTLDQLPECDVNRIAATATMITAAAAVRSQRHR